MKKIKGMPTPDTYVLGSTPVTDKKGNHLGGNAKPLYLASGKPHGNALLKTVPLWRDGKVIDTIVHWRNEAARRRCGGDKTLATADELVQVPIYRGVPASLARSIRGTRRREKRKSLIAAIKARITETEIVAA